MKPDTTFVEFIASLAFMLLMPLSFYYKFGPPYERRLAKKNLELSNNYDALKYL